MANTETLAKLTEIADTINVEVTTARNTLNQRCFAIVADVTDLARFMVRVTLEGMEDSLVGEVAQEFSDQEEQEYDLFVWTQVLIEKA